MQLLMRGLRLCCPRFSVYAACFDDCTPLLCLNAWLYMQTRQLLVTSSYKQKQMSATPLQHGPGESKTEGRLPDPRQERSQEHYGSAGALGESPREPGFVFSSSREDPAHRRQIELLLLCMEEQEPGEGERKKRRRRSKGQTSASDSGPEQTCDGSRRRERAGAFSGGGANSPRRPPLFLTPPAFFPSTGVGQEEELLLWLAEANNAALLVLWLCEIGMSSLVIRAFKLFDETNVVLDIILFFR